MQAEEIVGILKRRWPHLFFSTSQNEHGTLIKVHLADHADNAAVIALFLGDKNGQWSCMGTAVARDLRKVQTLSDCALALRMVLSECLRRLLEDRKA